jgi:hypothetical protein
MSAFQERGKAVWLIHNDMSLNPIDSVAPCMARRNEFTGATYSAPIIHTDMTTNFVDHYSNQEWGLFKTPLGYQNATNEYKTMFCLMFDLDPCLAGKPTNIPADERKKACIHFCEAGDDYDEIFWAVTLMHAEHLANVAVRAEYHGCLSATTPRMILILMALPRI